MANIKSAKKRILTNERNRKKNVAIKSSVSTAIKKVLEAIKKGEADQIEALVSIAYSRIDKAVSKGVFHKNNGARKKSRLVERVNKFKAEQSQQQVEA